jgi:hypothetical protein
VHYIEIDLLRGGLRMPADEMAECAYRVYDAAGYADYIYRGAPQPRLHPDDAAWARPFVPKPAP